jgi:hypothetical protein
MECDKVENLLSFQYKTLNDESTFDFNDAEKLISNQKNVLNKILVFPKNEDFESFKKLDILFDEQYTLILSLNTPQDIIEEILNFAIKSIKNLNVEFIDKHGIADIKKLAEIGLVYSGRLNLGIINIWANKGKNYNDTTPEFFYSNYGFKYFSKWIPQNRGGNDDRFIFDKKTYKYVKISKLEVKNIFGINADKKLFAKNFILINENLNSFVGKKLDEINYSLVQSGINFSI